MSDYDKEAVAFARARSLRDSLGIWPGVVRSAAGFRLTCDPEMPGGYPPAADDTAGPLIAVSGANLICPPSDQAQQGGKSDLPPESTGEARP